MADRGRRARDHAHDLHRAALPRHIEPPVPAGAGGSCGRESTHGRAGCCCGIRESPPTAKPLPDRRRSATCPDPTRARGPSASRPGVVCDDVGAAGARTTATTRRWSSPQSVLRFWMDNGVQGFELDAPQTMWGFHEGGPGGIGEARHAELVTYPQRYRAGLADLHRGRGDRHLRTVRDARPHRVHAHHAQPRHRRRQLRAAHDPRRADHRRARPPLPDLHRRPTRAGQRRLRADALRAGCIGRASLRSTSPCRADRAR